MKVFIGILVTAYAVLGASIDKSMPSLKGAKVYSATPTTPEQVEVLFEYQDVTGFEIFNRRFHLGDPIDIFVIADQVEDFEANLAVNEIAYTIRTEDVQEAVDEETSRQNVALAARASGTISFDAYYRYDAIVQYLQEIAAEYSNITTLFEIGSSYEGRTIYGLKISSGGYNKSAVVVDAAIHAREWITPAVALYIINQLVEGTDNNDLYETLDWYIIPVLNPDGYEYSHTNYRLWRKTRSVNINDWICLGTDGNRNYDYYWMESGASSDPCSQTYGGSSAFSEVEVQGLRDFILATDNIKLYLSFHSYGQYLLYPWSYTEDLPENAETLQTLGESVRDAISSYRGSNYTVGATTHVMYYAAGGSHDWVMGTGGVELTYTMEFPGGGLYGFDLPASEIVSVAEESMKGFRVLAEYVAANY